VGENAVSAIIDERNLNGQFKDIIDLTRRVNLRTINRRSLEAMANAGAFDTFEGSHRAQYFYQEGPDAPIFLEKVLKHASDYQAQKMGMQASLFGGDSEVEMPEVQMPECEPWSNFEQLRNEKEVTGFYMSGHPLDDYRLEIEAFCKNTIADIREENIKRMLGHQVSVAGIVTSSTERTTKNNTLFGIFVMEDHNDSVQLSMFSDDYMKFRHLLVQGMSLIVTGSVQKRFRDSDQIELKVSNVSLLAESIDKLTKSVTITLDAFEVNDEMVAMLKDAVSASRGNTPLYVNVVNETSRISVKMPSRLRIQARQLVAMLKNKEGIRLSLS
jgi:DNA polymerase-3 subunit alpha